VSLGSILLVAAIQLITLLAPVLAGLTGVISGGLAGLTSIVAWALLGVPLSYAAIDVLHATAASSKARAASAARATSSVLTT
jgi:hypothetical protein